MSQSISDEIAAIRAAVAGLASDLTSIAQQLADLKAQAGNSLSPADRAALDQLLVDANAAKATADTMAGPSPVPQPVP